MNPFARRYVLHALEAGPVLVEALTAGLTDAEADRRPDPERFTLREVLCHLADWEPIWLERVSRIARESNPQLPSIDEGQMAIANDYAHQDLATQIARYRAGRENLIAFLRALSPADWERSGIRDELGDVTIDDIATFVIGHDGYHYRQLVEFRQA